MISHRPDPPAPSGSRAGTRHPGQVGPCPILATLANEDETASSTITEGYVEMLQGLGRNGEAAALEAKVR